MPQAKMNWNRSAPSRKRSLRIAVLGMGAMGEWFARELAKGHAVAAYDRRALPPARPAPWARLRRLEELVDFRPDVLLNAVSIQETEAAFRQAAPFLEASCALVDIASVKGRLPEYYRSSPFPFASMHPMFGPRSAGRGRSRGENIILIRESQAIALEPFRRLARRLGLRAWELGFREHDEMMAYSLSLPFAATFAFSACVQGREVPGTTFSRHLEIARRLLLEDDSLLAEILFNPHSLPRLETICASMEFLKHVIRGRDREEFAKLLARLRRNLQLPPESLLDRRRIPG